MNILILVFSTLFINEELIFKSYKVERILLITSATLDIVTTRNAIINGAYEGNPLLNKLVGKKPSTIKLVGVKLFSIGLTEVSANYLKNKGKHNEARFLYWISIISWTYVSGLNLRFSW